MYIANARALQRERIFRDRTNPLDTYSDKKMHKYYRFTRNGVLHVIDVLSPHLQPDTLRSHSIDATTQVFVALRFFATGCFYSTTAEHHGVSEASVCRIVHRVANVLFSLREEHIKWPTEEKMNENKQEFHAVSGFPGAIGAVDGTHVPLDCSRLAPNEHIYVNRKGIHSINVQLICDPRYNILNVVARWAGSTHDSRILENSLVSQMYERGELSGTLLGDSGYPQRKWLMTPYRVPTTNAQRRYNS